MKKLFIILSVLFSNIAICFAQKTHFNYETFDNQILSYVPIKDAEVADKKFDYAILILKETKSAAKNDPQNLNVTDYWNITTAFIDLKEPKENIEIAFKKAIQADPKSVCGYISIIGTQNLETLIPNTFLPFYENCLESKSEISSFNLEKYINENKVDIQLVTKIDEIQKRDQKFRMSKPVDREKQKPLDLANEKSIDSIYNIYKNYVGKTLVGKKYTSVMWVVIQHSNVQMMERYLPIIDKAVQNKELDTVPFKMLIDRIYSIKYGYQIFGSQAKVDLADDKVRSEVIKKYNLE